MKMTRSFKHELQNSSSANCEIRENIAVSQALIRERVAVAYAEGSEQIHNDDENGEDTDPDCDIDTAILVPILQCESSSCELEDRPC